MKFKVSWSIYRLLEQEGPELRENIQDDVRTWFVRHKEETGK